jgi:hypothetical protein
MNKYKIYLSSSIEVLENEHLIGGANSYKEACKVIKDYLEVNKFHQEPYWRLLLGEVATFIDYGSWSKFIAIVPPISLKELAGEEINNNNNEN